MHTLSPWHGASNITINSSQFEHYKLILVTSITDLMAVDI